MPRVFITEDRAHASLTIQIVKTKFLADVLVFRNEGSAMRGNDETSWTFVDRREDAQITIFVHDGGHHRPDLRVAFVDSPMQAGWMRKAHPLRTRIGGQHPSHVMQ